MADYDPDSDDPLLKCEKPGMPSAMFNPHPFAFTDMGDYIRIDIQENDVTRQIWMVDNEEAAANRSSLGYSRGHWEDGNLIVQTTGINNPYFHRAGVSITESVVVDERSDIVRLVPIVGCCCATCLPTSAGADASGDPGEVLDHADGRCPSADH